MASNAWKAGVLRITSNQGADLFTWPRDARGRSGIDCNAAFAGTNMSEWVPIGREIGLSNLCRLWQLPITITPLVCPRVKALH